jgi:hypothetical protein
VPPVLIEQLVKYLLYGLMIAFLLRVAPLRRSFEALPRRHRRLLAGLFGLILFAQVVESKYETYPFVKWGMYSDFSGRITYYEYLGVRPDGVEEPFPLARLLRIYQPLCPTCSKRLVWRLDDLAEERDEAETEAERAEAADLYDRTLRAAWAAYAARNPGVAYDELRVWRGRIVVADYVDASSIERDFAWRVPLGGETPGALDGEARRAQ